MRVVFTETDFPENVTLLNTIRVPLKMHYLTNMLPVANYDPIVQRSTVNPSSNHRDMARRGDIGY